MDIGGIDYDFTFKPNRRPPQASEVFKHRRQRR